MDPKKVCFSTTYESWGFAPSEESGEEVSNPVEEVAQLISNIPRVLKQSRQKDPGRKWVTIGGLNGCENTQGIRALFESSITRAGYTFRYQEGIYQIRDPEVEDECTLL